jgi:hypothetical protein
LEFFRNELHFFGRLIEFGGTPQVRTLSGNSNRSKRMGVFPDSHMDNFQGSRQPIVEFPTSDDEGEDLPLRSEFSSSFSGLGLSLSNRFEDFSRDPSATFQSYSSSTFISYENGACDPVIVEKIHSQSQLPGGVNIIDSQFFHWGFKTHLFATFKIKESQMSSRDSTTGREKLTIKRSIGNRSRTMERERNREGHIEKKEILKNIAQGTPHSFLHTNYTFIFSF